MRINRKGFMLVEVIVVSTVVLTSMLALYSSFSYLYNNYKVKSTYYDLDGVYAIYGMIDDAIVMDEDNFNLFIRDMVSTSKYANFIYGGKCVKSINKCSKLQELYGIENMLIVEYNNNTLINLSVSNQTFKDYIDYIINYYDIKNDSSFSYIILAEIRDGDNYRYSNLRVR